MGEPIRRRVMVVFVFAADDLHTTKEMQELYDTKTLHGCVTVGPGKAKRVLIQLLQLDMRVVLPSDSARWSSDIYNVHLALRAVGALVGTAQDYLKEISLPAAAHAASPASHVAAVGNPIRS